MKHIILIRGINVGGKVLKMDALKTIVLDLGYLNPMSYIQSGNIIADTLNESATTIENRLKLAIKEKAELDVEVLAIGPDPFLRAAKNHPFQTHNNDKGVYLTFFKEAPSEDLLTILKDIESGDEQFKLEGKVLYGYYGLGYGKTKYTNQFFEKKFEMSATTRNWATVQKLAQLILT